MRGGWESRSQLLLNDNQLFRAPLDFLAMIIKISEGSMNLGQGQMRMGGQHFIGGHAQMLDFQSNSLDRNLRALNMGLPGSN
jgi:predicted Ser/Thr protein kinase